MKKMGRIPVVVFDVGGVLIEWDSRALYRELIPDAEEMEAFITTVCPGNWDFEQDGRRSFAEGLEELVSTFPDKADLIRAFDERWLETVVGPIQSTLEIMQELRAREIPIYALTNFSDVKFDQLREHFPFFADFNGIVVSAREGLTKPDPRIYATLCSRYGLAANQCIFIDDSIANVDGARAVGMSGHHFTTPENLREALGHLGLL